MFQSGSGYAWFIRQAGRERKRKRLLWSIFFNSFSFFYKVFAHLPDLIVYLSSLSWLLWVYGGNCVCVCACVRYYMVNHCGTLEAASLARRQQTYIFVNNICAKISEHFNSISAFQLQNKPFVNEISKKKHTQWPNLTTCQAESETLLLCLVLRANL